VILYDGILSVQDTIVIGGLEGPQVTKVRALMLPEPLAEMRDRKAKFRPVKSVSAATGVKLSCPDLKEAIAGMPLAGATAETLEAVKASLQAEVQSALIATDKAGILIRADTLGSLEALTVLLKERGVPIRRASVGPITKKDVSEAEAAAEITPEHALILGFNIPPVPSTERAHIITEPVIYRLIEAFEAWQAEAAKRKTLASLEGLVRPAKLEVLQNCIFRQSNPCILGVEVVGGTLYPNTPVMKAGKPIGVVKGVQEKNQNVTVAARGKQVAISLPGVTAGRQIEEGDILFSDVPEEDFRRLRDAKGALVGTDLSVLKEIAEIHRQDNPLWGV
jgi:translation initiation factor 5B